MRVAVIIVGLVVVSTPSQASKSCKTQAEARQQFANSHLYRHDPGHCWDAMTPSRRVVHRVRENVQREAQRDAAEPNNPEPKWREAMALRTPPGVLLGANEAPSPSVNWENRWVEIAQVNPTLASDKAEQEDASPNGPHRIEPMFTPMRVLLAFLALVLTLALIGTPFRSSLRTAALAGHDWIRDKETGIRSLAWNGNPPKIRARLPNWFRRRGTPRVLRSHPINRHVAGGSRRSQSRSDFG